MESTTHTNWRVRAARSLSGVSNGTLLLISLSTSTDLLVGLGTARLLCVWITPDNRDDDDDHQHHYLNSPQKHHALYRALEDVFLPDFFAGGDWGTELLDDFFSWKSNAFLSCSSPRSPARGVHGARLDTCV